VSLIRKHREIAIEILVYALYILAVLCAFWWLSSNHLILSKLFGVNDTVELNLDSIASILGIVAAALAIIISNRQQSYKEQQASRDQIYQQLEVESINLFRFEIANVELARIVWDDDEITFDELQKDKNMAYQVLQHICQVLNLFEMAVRFKRDGIAHEDVFMSWEAWIFELCKSKIFLNYWYIENVKDNYIKIFQDIIDDGLCCCHGKEKIDGLIYKQNNFKDNLFENFRMVMNKHLAV
jgi:hypothetical protein